MILVDTSVWVDHFRRGDRQLGDLLSRGQVLMHPFVRGELALGNLKPRAEILTLLSDLPHATVAEENELLHIIESRKLMGFGTSGRMPAVDARQALADVRGQIEGRPSGRGTLSKL
jgi:predicted nucleic acid-binding protein